MTAAIELQQVTTKIGDRVIHRDVDLAVQEGEVFAIIGGSGSGKTTLLRLMLGLQRPAAGEVRVLGQALGACDARELARVQTRRGVLFQQGALFSALSVFDNVALPLRELKTFPSGAIKDLVMLALSAVGLEAADAPKMPAELSGGMIKRVALARALVLGPSLLFLDEPTAGLDPASAKTFVRLIRGVRRSMRLTVVMVTHDVDTLCALADRVAVLADQRVVALGTLSEVARSEHPFVHDFFLGHQARCAEDGLRQYRASMQREEEPETAT
jgi:phospholipid/cholesterol/gamma-HCH transport system ATP-binding protein